MCFQIHVHNTNYTPMFSQNDRKTCSLDYLGLGVLHCMRGDTELWWELWSCSALTGLCYWSWGGFGGMSDTGPWGNNDRWGFLQLPYWVQRSFWLQGHRQYHLNKGFLTFVNFQITGQNDLLLKPSSEFSYPKINGPKSNCQTHFCPEIQQRCCLRFRFSLPTCVVLIEPDGNLLFSLHTQDLC